MKTSIKNYTFIIYLLYTLTLYKLVFQRCFLLTMVISLDFLWATSKIYFLPYLRPFYFFIFFFCYNRFFIQLHFVNCHLRYRKFDAAIEKFVLELAIYTNPIILHSNIIEL